MSSHSVETHQDEAPNPVRCMIVTVSDTRTKDADESGALISKLLEEHPHYEIIDYRIVKDEYDGIQLLLQEAGQLDECDVVLLNGGTGIAETDMTYEAVSRLLQKSIPGFGELFRYLCYENGYGSAAMLTRAIAGIMNDKAIFSMPGSLGAVRIAMEKLILPQLTNVVQELRNKRG